MNDLAEKALHGLDVARRQVRGHAVVSFAAAGFALAATVVVAGGAVGAANSTRPLTSWLGLQDRHPPRATDSGPATVMLAAVVALLALWIAATAYVRRRPQPPARVWLLAAAWGAPFALGPPLLDTGVYSYTAFGLVQRAGGNPYHSAPASLGDLPIVAAIDPGARGTPSGVGPLGTLVEHLAVSVGRGSALAAVLVLRVLAVVVVGWIGRLAAELGGDHADRALTLTALNPLVLLFVVSAAHLDGLVAALVLAALVAARQRHWARAVGLACVAGSVSGPGFVAAFALVVAHAVTMRRASQRPATRWRATALDLGVAAAVTCAAGFAVRGRFGWLQTASKQFADHTVYSAAGAVSALLAPIVRGASYDDVAIGGRVTALAALAFALGYLAATAPRRPTRHTVGYALLALGLLAPALHPWYLLWGVLCLAPDATGARRLAVVALSAAGCVLAPAGFSPTVADAVTGGLLAVIACGVAFALCRKPGEPRAEPARDGTLSAAG
ncbi:polyprenol phosphomannose-dependent alpha 1,6 mannosyltransferase MptB [uncultured Jatrophihabitans sp.]|uniref:polyprenol phosphomannose-dependent alpha 1,6 mannosyltransferase MptB n=1 Tax=uncultured Jatrophihabitans sp. TaxID=1610747 RepID=UPI0035CB80DA